MTLREILQKDKKSGLSVLNREADLERVVETIESTETPDVYRYVSANCFIITTGMIYQNAQEQLLRLIETLDALPCAGLAIKLGRFLGDLDPKVIEKADELRFPLLLIPGERTLGQVYQNMLSVLWNSQNIGLLEALNTKKKLYSLVTNGATMKRILRNMGSEIGRNILLSDAFGQYYENGNASGNEVKEGLKFIRSRGKELGQLQDSRQFSCQEECSISVYPIKSVSGNTHYLLVFDKEEQTPVSVFVMEEIVLLLEVILYRNQITTFNEMQRKDEFRKYLLSENGENWPMEQPSKWKQQMGFRTGSFYQVLLCRCVDFSSHRFHYVQFMQREEKYILGYRFVDSWLKENFGEKVLVLPNMDNWQYLMLFFAPCEGLNTCLDQMAVKLEETLKTKLVYSQGGRAWDQESIRMAYWRATENYEKWKQGGKAERFLDLAPKNVLETLWEIPRMQTDSICRNTLKELAYPENETGEELRKTLKTFLDCRCSITDTATQMYLHRNTIRYRISKCEDILGRKLDSSESCFEIQLALYLSEKESEK